MGYVQCILFGGICSLCFKHRVVVIGPIGFLWPFFFSLCFNCLYFLTPMSFISSLHPNLIETKRLVVVVICFIHRVVDGHQSD
jgi:hypothetical protein